LAQWSANGGKRIKGGKRRKGREGTKPSRRCPFGPHKRGRRGNEWIGGRAGRGPIHRQMMGIEGKEEPRTREEMEGGRSLREKEQ
jgi:hypothetical protein